MESTVYQGLWRNWSKGTYDRLMLTIPGSWGGIVVSFLTVLVSASSLHIWGILMFTIHQIRADAIARDALFHQQQVVLRNSRGDLPTLLQMSKLAWFWKKHTRSVFHRSFPLIVLCFFFSSGFFVASLFSSRLISFSDEVLIHSVRCGWIEDYPRMVQMVHTWIPTPQQIEVANALAVSARYSYRRSADYVRGCYIEQRGVYSSLCKTLAKQRIDSMVNHSKCPFTGDICAADAIVLDSGPINVDYDLGMTVRNGDRITVRRISTAVPLKMDNYVSDWVDLPSGPVGREVDIIPGDKYKVYNFGKNYMTKTNFSFLLSNITRTARDGAYFLSGMSAFADENDIENEFAPIPELKVKNADLTLLNLENKASYVGNVSDPWFSATSVTKDTIDRWLPDNEVAVMAYLEQYQFCSPSRCTEITGLHKLAPNTTGNLNLTPRQQEVYNVLWKSIWAVKVRFAIYITGVEAILAKDYLWGVNSRGSAPLPHNQWETEITNLHNVSLALLQRRLVEHAAPLQLALFTEDRNATSYIIQANTSDALDLCQHQRIRDAQYASFSVSALVTVILFACAIIAVNLSLEKIVAHIQKRFGVGEAKRLAWIETEPLQLQRLALEERGVGPWAGTQDDVPVTLTYGQTFHASKIYAPFNGRGEDVDLSLLSPKGTGNGINAASPRVGSGGTSIEGVGNSTTAYSRVDNPQDRINDPAKTTAYDPVAFR